MINGLDGLVERDDENSDRGFLKEFLPTNLPQPIPTVNLVLLNWLVATIYSLVKKPVPAKSSKPIARLGILLFFGL